MSKTRIVGVSVALAGALSVAAWAGAARAQDIVGDWHGNLVIPTGSLRIGLTVKPKAGGGYDGALQSPDQSAGSMPVEGVKVENGALDFTVTPIGGAYHGQWDAGRKAWVGEWRQAGQAFPLALAAGQPDALPVVQGLDGDWGGELTVNGARLRLVLHVRTGAAGTVSTLDSPDQLAYGIAARPFTREGQTVRFTVPAAAGATFEGMLSADGKAIAGTWSGVNYKGPLTFASRPIETAGPVRPQTPKPPFPYRTEEVTVASAPGVTLAGTLTLPQGKGPFPAVVMITGSGAQDRDETILGHKPFAVIADRLTRDGVAVLRVDDRGFAKSTGNFATATDDDFAVDAEAQVAFLRTRPEIDPKKIGLIGHSEGGLVAPKVAAKDPKVAFIVLMAGPGVPLSDVLRAQRAKLLPAMGQSPDQIQKSQAVFDRILVAMRGAKDEADARSRALEAAKAEGAEGPGRAQAEAMAVQLSNGWMRDLLDYDPRPTLAKVKCPILALNGSKDGQVPPEQNLPAIKAATRGNPDVTVEELPNLNHLFQTANTGAAGEYADIQETVAPIALDAMSSWIRKHTMR